MSDIENIFKVAEGLGRVRGMMDAKDADIERLTAEKKALGEELYAVVKKRDEADAEAERLQDEAIHNEGVMVALKEGYKRRGEEIERAVSLFRRFRGANRSALPDFLYVDVLAFLEEVWDG